MNKRYISIVIVTLMFTIAIIVIGPLDVFSHGYFCDVVKYDSVKTELLPDKFDLAKAHYELVFSPQKNILKVSRLI